MKPLTAEEKRYLIANLEGHDERLERQKGVFNAKDTEDSQKLISSIIRKVLELSRQ